MRHAVGCTQTHPKHSQTHDGAGAVYLDELVEEVEGDVGYMQVWHLRLDLGVEVKRVLINTKTTKTTHKVTQVGVPNHSHLDMRFDMGG